VKVAVGGCGGFVAVGAGGFVAVGGGWVLTIIGADVAVGGK